MIRITKRLTLISVFPLLLAGALNKGSAQSSSNLPDEPGLAATATFPERMALPDSPAPSALPDDSGQTTSPAVDMTTGVPQREATWRSIPGDFLHDQKDIWWTFPKNLAHGRYLVPTAIIVGGTAGLIYADPHAMPYFQTHQKNWDKVNDVFDPMITTGEVIALPAGLLTAGYLRHDRREVNTALLAVEAYGDTVVVNLAIKAVTRRQRPSDVAQGGDFTGTFFNGGKSPFKGSSFPSGHSMAVWSVATVVAERYRHRGKPWIPILSYTLATAISFSRITESAHFPSDVWLGASLGYTIARYQTLRPRQ
jgi:membrane-associated phospholipid phosphatase